MQWDYMVFLRPVFRENNHSNIDTIMRVYPQRTFGTSFYSILLVRELCLKFFKERGVQNPENRRKEQNGRRKHLFKKR